MKFAIPVLLVAIIGFMFTFSAGDRARAYTTCGSPQSMSSFPIPVWLSSTGDYGTLTRAEVSRELDRALADWQNLPDSAITFYRTDSMVNGWYPKLSINPDAYVTTGVATTQCNFGGYTQWMSLLSTYTNWDTDASDGITPGKLSLAMVLRHEIGHFLGLNHSCDVPQSLMCVGWDPAVPTYGVDMPIDSDAQRAMAIFYGGGTSTPTSTATPTSTPTPTSTVTSCERVATYSDGTVIRTALALSAC